MSGGTVFAPARVNLIGEHTDYAERRTEVERGDPRRIGHVASENERVRRVVSALEAGDVDALGPFFRAGHDSLRDDFEVSTLSSTCSSTSPTSTAPSRRA